MIRGEIVRRSRPVITCSVCGTKDWTLANGFVSLPVTLTETVQVIGSLTPGDELEHIVAASSGTMPCVALVCNKCGHTLFFNVFFLGLQDLLPKSLKDVMS